MCPKCQSENLLRVANDMHLVAIEDDRKIYAVDTACNCRICGHSWVETCIEYEDISEYEDEYYYEDGE
jgi:hypothetical protein